MYKKLYEEEHKLRSYPTHLQEVVPGFSSFIHSLSKLICYPFQHHAFANFLHFVPIRHAKC